MIVLDEQLLGRGIEGAIAHWYPSSVRFITELRPGTVIKDEAIPTLLAQANEPTFVTINETDFWRRVAITDRFCVVCLALSDSRATEVPGLLQRFLRHPHSRTKARRMGLVIRITEDGANYYSTTHKTIRAIENW
jgi:hypothetical protein